MNYEVVVLCSVTMVFSIALGVLHSNVIRGYQTTLGWFWALWWSLSVITVREVAGGALADPILRVFGRLSRKCCLWNCI